MGRRSGSGGEWRFPIYPGAKVRESGSGVSEERMGSPVGKCLESIAILGGI